MVQLIILEHGVYVDCRQMNTGLFWEQMLNTMDMKWPFSGWMSIPTKV